MEETILDMPLAKIWQYRHALLRSYDMPTRFITTKEEKQEMYELFKNL